MTLIPETMIQERKVYYRKPSLSLIKQGVLFNKASLREIDYAKKWGFRAEKGTLFFHVHEEGYQIIVRENGGRISSHPLARKLKEEYSTTHFILEKIAKDFFKLTPI